MSSEPATTDNKQEYQHPLHLVRRASLPNAMGFRLMPPVSSHHSHHEKELHTPNTTLHYHNCKVYSLGEQGSRESLQKRIRESQNRQTLKVNWAALHNDAV